MADIFDEVEESLRKDKASALWKRYGPLIIGGCVLFVGAIGAIELWRWQRAETVESGARVYAAAMQKLDNEDFDGAVQAFSEIAAGNDGFAQLAGHMAAIVEKRRGGDAEAVLAHLSGQARKESGFYSDLAILKQAYMQADTASLAELEAIVAPLVAQRGELPSLARELVAAKALAEGDIERARRELQALALDIDVPQGMSMRVQQVLITLPAPQPAAAGEPLTESPAQPDQANP